MVIIKICEFDDDRDRRSYIITRNSNIDWNISDDEGRMFLTRQKKYTRAYEIQINPEIFVGIAFHISL